jgi:hypothetical protein
VKHADQKLDAAQRLLEQPAFGQVRIGNKACSSRGQSSQQSQWFPISIILASLALTRTPYRE